MNGESAYVGHLALATNFGDFVPIKHAPVRVHPRCEIRMFFTDKEPIAPLCLATFTTKE